MLKNILNEVSNFTADTDNQFALLTDEELKNIISSSAYNQDYKNRAKNELQVRINKNKQSLI
jgi:hypothetical protein